MAAFTLGPGANGGQLRATANNHAELLDGQESRIDQLEENTVTPDELTAVAEISNNAVELASAAQASATEALELAGEAVPKVEGQRMITTAEGNTIATVPTLTGSVNYLSQKLAIRRGAFANKSNVSFGSRLPFLDVLSDGTETTQTSRIRHKAIGNISDLELFFMNTQPIQAASTLSFSPITIEASIEYPEGTFTRVTFRGGNVYTIPKNLTVKSDYVPIEIPNNAYFWIRTNVLVTAGQIFLKNYAVDQNWEGVVLGQNLVMSGLIPKTTPAYTYSASLVLGVSDSNKPSIFLFGDSLSIGTGDDKGIKYGFDFGAFGLYGRAFLDNYPVIVGNIAGQKISNWSPQTSFSSKYFGEALSSGQFAISDLMVNDLSDAQATIQNNLISVWRSQKSRGIKIYQTTCTPYTSSTDAWVTLANQTVTANESKRVFVNTWLRDGAPIDLTTFSPVAAGTVGSTTIVRMGTVYHPLAGVFEIADLVESARNSGKWKIVTGAAITGDGLHPNPLGYSIAYLGIDLSVFTL